MKQRMGPDAMRVVVMIVVASVLLFLSTPAAVLLHEPALAAWGMYAGLAVYCAALSHVLRRAFFPYLDLRDVAYRAIAHPVGAGLVFVGVCVVLYGLLGLVGNAAHAGTVPANAATYLPALQAEKARLWADGPPTSVFAAQVEQETCISLTHSRCWSPRAELRTSRERGVGLGQITRTSRFDSLAEMRQQNAKELAGWSWDDDSIYDPKYQLRALLLMDKRNHNAITGTLRPQERVTMALVAYNGGLGGLNSDRRVCAATPGCNPGIWFGHVELTSLKARAAASGYGKSFFAINREYPRNILFVRRPKYIEYLGE